MIPGIGLVCKPLMRVSAKTALAMVGLTASLVLDAGDSNSYSGSGQQWSDVSGNGNHFYRGSTSGADTTDPTFAGSAGGLSAAEYFSFDGGDFFTPTGAPTFDDALHHAGAKFTYITVSNPASVATRCFFGNSDSGTLEGVFIGTASNNGNEIIIRNGTGNAFGQTTTVMTSNQWNFAAWSIDEAAGANGSFSRVNRTTVLTNAAYTSPGVANANSAPQIGARGGTSLVQILASGDRMAMLIIVNNTAWTRSQMAAFHSLMQGRFITI